MATEVTIKIRAFPFYTDAEDNVTGRKVRQEHIATRGDKVELSDVDLERAKRFDAIYTDEELKALESGDNAPTPPADGAFAVDTASVEELSVWLKGERPEQDGDKPTVDEVVSASNDQGEVASRLIEAENLATGQQPRSTLVERLQAIVDATT